MLMFRASQAGTNDCSIGRDQWCLSNPGVALTEKELLPNNVGVCRNGRNALWTGVCFRLLQKLFTDVLSSVLPKNRDKRDESRLQSVVLEFHDGTKDWMHVFLDRFWYGSQNL